MRHRRHALISAHPRSLRATAATPCVAALLVALLTGAAPGPGPGAHPVTAAKSPVGHGTSHAGHGTSRTRPAPPSAAPAEAGPEAGAGTGAGAGAGAFGEHDLYENDPGYDPLEYDYAPSTGQRPTTAATGGVSPVLPLGAGMTLIGLGLALIALRLRRA